MKPVAWQFYSNGKWLTPGSQDENFRDWAEKNGYETRSLYAIPDEYVVVPVEITNAISLAMRDYMSHLEAEWVWDNIIKLAQEESE